MRQVTIIVQHPTLGHWFGLRGRGRTREIAYNHAIARARVEYGFDIECLFVYINFSN